MKSEIELSMDRERNLEAECAEIWGPERARAEAQRLMERTEAKDRRLRSIWADMEPELRRQLTK
jgi:hypothetical protein